MKQYLAIAIISLTLSNVALGLVSSPAGVNEGDWSTELRSTFERGKSEPNENTQSHQKANINIAQLSIAHGLGAFSFGSDHFARIDLKVIQSGKEEVLGQKFYDEDRGYAASLTYGFNFVHAAPYSVGFYISISPLTKFDKEKFSVPRIDLWRVGLRGGTAINENWFQEYSAHFGSGIPNHQNSYIALTQLVGFKFEGATGIPLILKFGPYLEIDAQERHDRKYDLAFSPPGTRDRIRSAKLGITGVAEFQMTENTFGSLDYIQKIGGYDAPATNATSLALGFKF